MRELLGLISWFFGMLIVVGVVVLGLSLLGPVIGIGLLCVIVYGLFADGE